MKTTIDQFLLKDAREKLSFYVPDEHVPVGLVERLRLGNANLTDEAMPDVKVALAEAADIVDKHARRQGKKRMTEYAGRHIPGRAPFVESHAQGQHYPQVQSFIDRARNAIK